LLPDKLKLQSYFYRLEKVLLNKKKITHITVKSIHSSLRSESKIGTYTLYLHIFICIYSSYYKSVEYNGFRVTHNKSFVSPILHTYSLNFVVTTTKRIEWLKYKFHYFSVLFRILWSPFIDALVYIAYIWAFLPLYILFHFIIGVLFTWTRQKKHLRFAYVTRVQDWKNCITYYVKVKPIGATQSSQERPRTAIKERKLFYKLFKIWKFKSEII